MKLKPGSEEKTKGTARHYNSAKAANLKLRNYSTQQLQQPPKQADRHSPKCQPKIRIALRAKQTE